MKKINAFFAVILAFVFMLSGCRSYSLETLTVYGWNSSDGNYVPFTLGEFQSRIIENIPFVGWIMPYETVTFEVKDRAEFENAVLNHKNFLKTDIGLSDKQIHVLFNAGNYYYIYKTGDCRFWNDKKGYTFDNGFTSYVVSDTICYLFPLYDTAAFTLKMNFHYSNIAPEETSRTWEYWKEYYERIGSEYCDIDEENKSVDLSVSVVDKTDSENRTLIYSEKRLVRLIFTVEGGKNMIYVSLIG